MVLDALAAYGQELVDRGVISKSGWSSVPVQFAIIIGSDGRLINVVSLGYQVPFKKKTVTKYPTMSVPYRTKHQNGPTPFFACDNASYLLGLAGEKDAPEKVAAKHRSAKHLHEEILGPLLDSSSKATALWDFFAKWDPQKALDMDCIKENLDAILTASNLVFRFEDDTYAHADPDIAAAWDKYYQTRVLAGSDIIMGTCLVTGEENVPIARVHPATTGVPMARGTGISLVSFGTNYDVCAYNWYDKQQGYIAPVSLLVTEQYGNALKYLLTTKCHYKIIGNSYLVFWAAHDEDNSLATAFSMAGFGRQEGDFDSEEDEALYHTVTSILSGNESAEKYADQLEDLNADFYVMVLRNHNVRFALTEFQHCTFGQMLENLRAHLKRATIISSRDDKETATPNIYQLLDALKCVGKDNREVPADMYDSLVRAIITNTPYPRELLSLLLLRIREDGVLSENRMAAIKMYLLKNSNSESVKEAATVAINPNCNEKAYLLGQLFWHYEKLQKTAMKKVNRSIRDSFFTSAMTRPASVFPSIFAKGQHHISSLERKSDTAGLAVYYNQLIGGIMDRLGSDPLPTMFSREESSLFALGYYHARQESYRKKPDDDPDGAGDNAA